MKRKLAQAWLLQWAVIAIVSFVGWTVYAFGWGSLLFLVMLAIFLWVSIWAIHEA